MILGMIYMEPDALGWDPLLQSWIANIPPAIDEWLENFLYRSLFRRFCDPILHWLHTGHVEVLDFHFKTYIHTYKI